MSQRARSSRLRCPNNRPRSSPALTSRVQLTWFLSHNSSQVSRALCSTSTSQTRYGTSSVMPKIVTGSASKKQFSLVAKTLILESEFMREVQNHTMLLLAFLIQSFKSTTSTTCQEDTSVTWTTQSLIAHPSQLRTPP